MNVYDFDGTIYDGDSSVDFFKFCIGKKKRCLIILPKFGLMVILYFLKLINKEKLKSTYFNFIKFFDDIDKVAEEFWIEKNYELKSFYKDKQKSSDIVISASPFFLLNPVAKKYGFELIASEVDKKTGKFIGENCFGENKVNRLRERGISKIKEFYSDSRSDEPLSKIAQKAYLVDGDLITDWSDKD